MKEDYVSFEVAKLLKEKGFKGQYHMYYIEDGVYKCDDLHDIKDYAKSIAQFEYLHRTKVIAPTLQMAMKWLREKGIECVVIPIWNTIGKQYRSYVLSDLGDKYKDNYDSYSDNISYEEAAEAAIKYSLENLI